MIRLIASDIDGTLVPDGTDKIDPRMFDLILRMKKAGIAFAAASGRQYLSIRKLFKPVMDDIYYITESGSVLRDRSKVYYQNIIDPRQLFDMIDDIRRIDRADIMLCSAERAYCEDASEMYIWMRDSYKYDIRAIGDFRDNLHDDIVKISIYDPDEKAEEKVNEWFAPKWGETFKIVAAGTMWQDITAPGSTKGGAIKRLQSELGISREVTMAFGDNLNDLDMLDAAEESYAIGSARPEVREAAKHVADTLQNQGAVKAIEQYLDMIGA